MPKYLCSVYCSTLGQSSVGLVHMSPRPWRRNLSLWILGKMTLPLDSRHQRSAPLCTYSQRQSITHKGNHMKTVPCLNHTGMEGCGPKTAHQLSCTAQPQKILPLSMAERAVPLLQLSSAPAPSKKKDCDAQHGCCRKMTHSEDVGEGEGV